MFKDSITSILSIEAYLKNFKTIQILANKLILFLHGNTRSSNNDYQKLHYCEAYVGTRK